MKKRVVTLYSDPLQFNIWSVLKENFYSSFDLIIRENIDLMDQQVISLGPIRQISKILPASILNKKYKTILGSHNVFDINLLKCEIEENSVLGFHITDKNLAIHPFLDEEENNNSFFTSYIAAYDLFLKQSEQQSILRDATICSAESGVYDKKLKKLENIKSEKSFLVLPFVIMVSSELDFPTLFESNLEQDFVIDQIQQRGYVDFDLLSEKPKFGWFDCIRARYLAKLYECDGIILTFPDFIPKKSKVKICTAYQQKNELLQNIENDFKFSEISPFYEVYDRWSENLSDYSELYDFPGSFFKLLKRIEQIVNCPVISVFTGNSNVPLFNVNFPTVF